MCGSSRGHRLGAVVGVLLWSLPSVVTTQTLPTKEPVHWIQRFLGVAFPDLAAQGYLLRLHVSVELDRPLVSGACDVGVGEFSLVRYGPPDRGGTSSPLRGSFHLAPGTESAHFTGPLIPEVANAALTKEAESHPDWTDDDMLVALRRLEARFPPDRQEAFRRHADVERYASLLGPIAKAEIRFQWRHPLRPEMITPPQWYVELETGNAQGKPACYVLSYEPLEGRLQDFFWIGCDALR